MTKTFPSKRDCEHGNKRGSCELCDCYERIAELEKIITQIKEVAEFHPPDRAIINLVKLALKEK